MTWLATYKTENDYGQGEVRSWASIIEDNTRGQAETISRATIVQGHVALMPDAHFGFGPPVGSVILTKGGVMPYAVGVDIGCGMIAVKTDIERYLLQGHEGQILGNIRELIPSGVGTAHKEPLPQYETFIRDYGLPPALRPGSKLEDKRSRIITRFQQLSTRLSQQFGTLGSGNHFVEVCTDNEGTVWLLLHSGSRGIGNVLATAHVYQAKLFCELNGIKIESQEFAYFMAGTKQYDDYLKDMMWAQAYALNQREAMMDQLMIAVSKEIGDDWNQLERINCHHNYAEQMEDDSLLTRKGAIDASLGKMGIIPGSMGTATHIVRGLGNEEAHNSSPHGAGRIRGRKAAKQTLSVDRFKEQMKGRTWQDRDAKELLDEAPDAYKPIEIVIKDSESLIESVTVISQFINYKGVESISAREQKKRLRTLLRGIER